MKSIFQKGNKIKSTLKRRTGRRSTAATQSLSPAVYAAFDCNTVFSMMSTLGRYQTVLCLDHLLDFNDFHPKKKRPPRFSNDHLKTQSTTQFFKWPPIDQCWSLLKYWLGRLSPVKTLVKFAPGFDRPTLSRIHTIKYHSWPRTPYRKVKKKTAQRNITKLTKEPRGLPFPTRWLQGCKEHTKH